MGVAFHLYLFPPLLLLLIKTILFKNQNRCVCLPQGQISDRTKAVNQGSSTTGQKKQQQTKTTGDKRGKGKQADRPSGKGIGGGRGYWETA